MKLRTRIISRHVSEKPKRRNHKNSEERALEKARRFVEWYARNKRFPDKNDHFEYQWICTQRKILSNRSLTYYQSVHDLLDKHVPIWRNPRKDLINYKTLEERENRTIEKAWVFIKWYRRNNRYPKYDDPDEAPFYQWIGYQRKTLNNPQLTHYISVWSLLDQHVPVWRGERKNFTNVNRTFEEFLLADDTFIEPPITIADFADNY